MAKTWFLFGTLFGFFSVAFGAFGAHGLEKVLSEYGHKVFQTATLYLMFHALALLSYGTWSHLQPNSAPGWIGWTFVAGILIFSGSLYALAITEVKVLGAITPLGGTAFLVAWLGFAWQIAKSSL